ncbi:hypothetical protein L596_012352 [Steinernema carpocapsae]|uniref:Autophagy-related protein n=1 Tax=Steinernema carpocapsae TaxID=34508 RepID=A0A4U5NXL8_STECR|nr:hypothetical protein L596_012352 [Steinernema carpocapsae]
MSQEPRFKERKSLVQRKRLFKDGISRFPDKIPVIIERSFGEKHLPFIDRNQFLVHDHVSVAEITSIIRRRLHLLADQSLVIFVNETQIPSAMSGIRNVYEVYKDEDGFLYLSYASQSFFG